MKRYSVMNFIPPVLIERRDYVLTKRKIVRTLNFAGAALVCLLIIQVVVLTYNFMEWYTVDTAELQRQYTELGTKLDHLKHVEAVTDEAEAADLKLTRILVELAKIKPSGIKFTSVNADGQSVTIEGYANRAETIHRFSNDIDDCDDLFTDVEAQRISLESDKNTFVVVAGVRSEVKN